MAGADTPPLEGLLAGLRLALGSGDPAAQREALAGVHDWPAVADLVAHHRVGTLFLTGVEAAGLPLSDPAVARALARQRRREVVRGIGQLAAMKRATAALDAAGIPSLILKGLPLSQRVYGGPFAKSSIDIDLLVAEDAFAAAAGVLRAAGWRCTMPAFRETPARMRWYDSVENHHVFAGHQARIELHRRLLANPCLFDPPFDDLYSRGLIVKVGPDPFRTLGDSDQFLYLACHGAFHYWQRVKWLCDFAALLRAMEGGVIARTVTRGREQRLGCLLAAALRLCREDLRVEAPEAASALREGSLRTRVVVALSRRAWTPRNGLRRLVREVGQRAGRLSFGPSGRYAAREARGMLIGRHDFSRVDLPDRLFWLYFVLWPFLAAARLRRQAEAGDETPTSARIIGAEG